MWNVDKFLRFQKKIQNDHNDRKIIYYDFLYTRRRQRFDFQYKPELYKRIQGSDF